MRAYFLSDLHLGAPYFEDSHKAERRVCDFLDSIKGDADVIYLLGDILDYWFEYRYVVPRGFVRFFGKLAELHDMGIRIVWFIGNHDIWIFDYLPSELGVEVVDGSLVECIDGHWFLMNHGDGIGRLKPSFRILRKLFRNKTCQRLFSGIHPRWTVPFAHNWSRHSRKAGKSLPSADSGTEEFLAEGKYAAPAVADAGRMLDNVVAFSRDYLNEHPEINYFIFGHLHLLKEIPLAPGSEIVILGEWLSLCSYAFWDGTSLTLHRFRR